MVQKNKRISVGLGAVFCNSAAGTRGRAVYILLFLPFSRLRVFLGG